MPRLFLLIVSALFLARLVAESGQGPIEPVAVLTDIAGALVDTSESVGKFAERLKKEPRAILNRDGIGARAGDRLKHIGRRAGALHQRPGAIVEALEARLEQAWLALDGAASSIEREAIAQLTSVRRALDPYLF